MPNFVGAEPTECRPNSKTGSWFTGSLHATNAIVGAGVLSLPWAVAQLGWVAGPLLLVLFYLVTRRASIMLAELYCVDGLEHARYHHAVRHILGRRGALWTGIFQTVNLVLLCVAYCIIGAESMKYIATTLGSSFYKQYQMAMLFGLVELVLSQLPNLEDVWWVSLLGSAMSLTYCTVALVLGAVYAGARQGSVRGVSGLTTTEKAFNCLNALGSIGFAYSVSNVLIEITDTMRQPPSAVVQMKRAINVSLTVAGSFYLGVACTGYASLGDATPSLILSGFTDAPQWAVLLAHFAIVVSMMTTWQIFAQPVFDLLESKIKAWRIRRQLQHAHPKAAPAAPDSSRGKGTSAGSMTPMPSSARLALPAESEEVRMEAGALPLPESPLGPGRLCARCLPTGQLVLNSSPVPDMLPSEGWAHQKSFMKRTLSVELLAEAAPAPKTPKTPRGAHAAASTLAAVLDQSRTGMYHNAPGLTNEHVPLNDTGYLLPLPQRLAVRTLYVLTITLLAVVAPFVMSVIGLVGSVGWYPLTIAFPFLCWIKVYRPTGLRLAAIRTVGLIMLLAAAGATVGAVYTMVHSFQTVEFFQ